MGVKEVNEALGISSIDDFLKDLDADDPNIGKMDEVDEKVKENVSKIDSSIQHYNKGELDQVDMAGLRNSLDEIRELIDSSKDVIKYTHQQICNSELLDPEVVQAFSKVLESAHLTISEYIGLYKDRMAFYDKVRLKMIDFEQKKALIQMKHDLDMQKAESKKSKDIPDSNTFTFSQEDIIKTLDQEDKKD